ncbi:putative manganese-dependent inorganic diphosphatase [Holophaga foetida]|uniref:putative manganese-dependent inorganic diphosphatase n=1 Tax=Holophaga foetida TaxID=35839 RepID=UPI0002474D2D|nr:putative manganese-dependent inorganic diphosphatase [Holophaga foetida]
MEPVVYITGHRNPDTDSICAAIAYAELKKKLGVQALACRLGEVNRETAFVLNHFGVKAPENLVTVKTQVCDLDMDPANAVSPGISVKAAWRIMRKHNVKTLPVVDDHQKLMGLLTVSDITTRYLDAIDNNPIAASQTPLANVVETLSAQLVWGSAKDFNPVGKIAIAAAQADDMQPFVDPGDIVIAGNRIDAQLKAMACGANCLILTCGTSVADEVLRAAEEHRCVVMTTQADTFTAARLINLSIPVSFVMSNGNLISFNVDDYVDDIKDKMLKTRYRSYPVVDDNNVIQGFISRYHLISYRNKKVILVDHNEKSQTVHGIEEAEILEIIDHHRLGDIQTANPIYFKNEPLGSTSTIIANLYFEAGIRPTKSIAGILCAAIISDTIQFKSPTSTYTDKLTAERLADIAAININDFALAMFKAGSTLVGKTPQEILTQDIKEFRFTRHKIAIAQVYTMGDSGLEDVREELIEYMNMYCVQGGYNLLMLLVTDILSQGSEVLFTGQDRDLVGKAFRMETEDGRVHLDGVVSRKKQVVPVISAAAEEE